MTLTSDQIASLLYLALLGAVVAGYALLSMRGTLGQGLRQAGLWLLLFLGVIAGYGLWSDIQGTVMPRQAVFAEAGRIEVPRAPDGHYYLTVAVNGAPVRFVVDTGATDLVLSRRDAERAGIDVAALAFAGSATTANGVVPTARIWLDTVAIGPLRDTRVAATVNGGEMQGSLLGMAYLERFAEVTFGGGRMVLSR